MSDAKTTLDLADEFDGMAKAHKAMGEKDEAGKFTLAAKVLRASTAASQPVDLLEKGVEINRDLRVTLYEIQNLINGLGKLDRERIAPKIADALERSSAMPTGFDINLIDRPQMCIHCGLNKNSPFPCDCPPDAGGLAKEITDEDRNYASELLGDLANGDLPRLEIAARWFRKARIETLLAQSLSDGLR